MAAPPKVASLPLPRAALLLGLLGLALALAYGGHYPAAAEDTAVDPEVLRLISGLSPAPAVELQADPCAAYSTCGTCPGVDGWETTSTTTTNPNNCHWCHGVTRLTNKTDSEQTLEFPSFIAGECTSLPCGSLHIGTVDGVFDWTMGAAYIQYGIEAIDSKLCKTLKFLGVDTALSAAEEKILLDNQDCASCTSNNHRWCHYDVTVNFTTVPEILEGKGGACETGGGKCIEANSLVHFGMTGVVTPVDNANSTECSKYN